MNQMGDSSRRKSRSPDESYAKRSILSNIDKSQLSTLKVTIKKRGVIATAPNLPLERSIDDYAKICSYVHVRKGIPPRVPVFGGDIKVDQNFGSSRTVYYYDSGQGTSNSVTESDVMDERNRIRDRSRRRSKSNSSERYRRSLSKPKNTRSDSRRYRSRSRERRYSSERRNHRGRSSRSRSRSVSRHRNRSITPSRRSSRNRSRSVSRHRHRSITPLRPGEYRPGHPDLALRKEKRRVRVSYSRSPSKSRGSRADSSMSKERLSSERSVSRRRSRSRRRSPVIPPPRMMPGMEYGYYGGYPPFGMPPYSPRLPMMGPNFYRMPFHNGMMAPRMFNRMMPIREPRLPVYNQVISKPATVTSKSEADSAQSITVEQLTNVSTETNEAVLSAGITDDQEKNTVTEELKS